MIVVRKFYSFTLVLIFLYFFTSIIGTTSACTIFTISRGEKVFFGNNEDWHIPDTYIWFELPKENKHGCVFLGFDDFFPQGGMNEKGLCFDANALPRMDLNPHPELPYSQKWIALHLIETCDNVSQVIDVAQEYNWGNHIEYQVHFADSLGNAVVISAGTDGELNFTRKYVGDGFLVSTNFNVGYPTNGWIPCWRYPIATDMLGSINQKDNLSVAALSDILEATHQEGTYATKYSNIFDLVNRDIYIYQNYNFNAVVRLNLEDELAKGNENYILISDLFTKSSTQLFQTEKTLSATSQESIPAKTPESPLLLVIVSLLVIVTIRNRNKL